LAIVSAFHLPHLIDAPGGVELNPKQYARARLQFGSVISARSDVPPSGFSLEHVNTGFVGAEMRELEDECHGGGYYLVRRDDSGAPLLISAPHRGSDLLTGRLALRLFLESKAAAAAWNSIHRRSAERCGHGTSDLARLRLHSFTAFSAAFASAHPEGRVIQLHGFDPQRRSSAVGRQSSAILSSGSAEITPAVHAVAQCLQAELLEERISTYPADVGELGARQNAQGQELRALGFKGFIHVELAHDLRRRLVEHGELRNRFARCLEAGL
jgi:hypothetical protein